jgi:hypothetical protein
MDRERQAVEIALAALGDQLGRLLQLRDERPDEVERSEPAVDFTADGDRGVMSIEHTQIGAFDQQERLEVQMTNVLDGLCRDLEGALPRDARFDLSVSAHDAPRIQERDLVPLKEWIRQVAPTLTEPPGHRLDSPNGLLPCTLSRWPLRLRPGSQLELRVEVRLGPELEALRLERLRRAAERKLPKLEASRSNLDAVDTLLVLDSPDWAVSGTHDIRTALLEAVIGLPLPDHIVVVESDDATVIRLDGEWR